MMGKRKKIYQSHFNFGMNNFEDPLRNKKVGDKKELNNKKEKDQRIISGVSTEIIVWICIKSHRQTTVQMVTFFRTHHSLWTLATLAMPFQSFQNSFTYPWFLFLFLLFTYPWFKNTKWVYNIFYKYNGERSLKFECFIWKYSEMSIELQGSFLNNLNF